MSNCASTIARCSRSRAYSASQLGSPSAYASLASLLRAVGQVVGLTIVHRLEPVLERAQETIGRRELRDRALAQLAVAREQGQCGEQRARPQLRAAPAAHELKRLHDELDLADAAGAELDVLGHVLAGDFLAISRFIWRSASNTP